MSVTHQVCGPAANEDDDTTETRRGAYQLRRPKWKARSDIFPAPRKEFPAFVLLCFLLIIIFLLLLIIQVSELGNEPATSNAETQHKSRRGPAKEKEREREREAAS